MCYVHVVRDRQDECIPRSRNSAMSCSMGISVNSCGPPRSLRSMRRPVKTPISREVLKLAGPPDTEQRNTQIDSSGRPSTTSSESLHRLRKRDTGFPIVSRRGGNSNLFTIALVGFTLALIPVIILIPQHLSVL